MKRRNLILGLGSLTAGSAVVGSGAFSTAEATRDATVEVADDSTGYLSLQPAGGPNGQFASQSGDTIGLDFSGSNNSGSGVGQNSVYNFDDVLTVTNQGTQTVYVWVNFSGSSFDDSNLYLYPNGARDKKLNDGSNSVLTLGAGESASIGVHIDTGSGTSNGSPTMTINADVDKPGASGSVGPGGDETLVVSQSPGPDEFGSIQTAIDAADSTTIVVEPGTYDEFIDIDKSLTLRGPNAGVHAATGNRDSEAVINRQNEPDSGGAAVTISAPGVTLEGFEIKSNAQDGINVPKPDSDIVIKNNRITGVTGNGFAGTQAAANGINFQYTSASNEGEGTNATGLVVENNLIENVSTPDVSGEESATGLQVLSQKADVTGMQVVGNLFRNISAEDEGRGITVDNNDQAGSVDSLEIRGNTFESISGAGGLGTSAINLFEGGDDPREGPRNFNIVENLIDGTTFTATGQDKPLSLFVGGYEELGNGHVVNANEFRDAGVVRYAGSQTGFDLTDADVLNVRNNYWGAGDGPHGEDGVGGSGTFARTAEADSDDDRTGFVAAGEDSSESAGFRASPNPDAGV